LVSAVGRGDWWSPSNHLCYILLALFIRPPSCVAKGNIEAMCVISHLLYSSWGTMGMVDGPHYRFPYAGLKVEKNKYGSFAFLSFILSG